MQGGDDTLEVMLLPVVVRKLFWLFSRCGIMLPKNIKERETYGVCWKGICDFLIIHIFFKKRMQIEILVTGDTTSHTPFSELFS